MLQSRFQIFLVFLVISLLTLITAAPSEDINFDNSEPVDSSVDHSFDTDTAQNDSRAIPIVSIPNPDDTLTCQPGYFPECTLAKCMKRRGKTLDEEVEDESDELLRLTCTATKPCPNGRKCRCVRTECVGGTDLPPCRCPCEAGPCPNPCGPVACTLQACPDPPKCL